MSKVAASRFLLGERFPVSVYLSLVPIIGGCALAAATELNFSMTEMNGKPVSGMNYYACPYAISADTDTIRDRGGRSADVGSWLAEGDLTDQSPFCLVTRAAQHYVGSVYIPSSGLVVLLPDATDELGQAEALAPVSVPILMLPSTMDGRQILPDPRKRSNISEP
ncbi:Glucose-6-phosphate phosphate translocator [Musa troglodytarum]|uniref:Glucose-6-phosphate phosphate translocator n=1 Tax=Musa troglodytarum TaxID=320322 RepID=A0A9E7JQN4_9LILI|nr:Glucose-6-phosphate phosphate translocator [Musa troglodytarum]